MNTLSKKAFARLESLFAEPIENIDVDQESVRVTLTTASAAGYPDTIELDGKSHRLDVVIAAEPLEIDDLSA